ncbi:hypothetical protein [Schlesneria sp. T3-172]|uniref:hypothetical protein n=1 Tax=Schlesneria sphaerica TaxID=3373610 RepID=UPI0037C992FE
MDLVSRRRFVAWTVAQGCLCLDVGCGTILHPERRGQPAGPLDWKIVALDAVGLMFFFVPGVIAFAVDFNNGTIYLPHEHHGRKPQYYADQEFAQVTVPRDEISAERIEQVVAQHTTRKISLKPGTYQTEELKSIDDFWKVKERCRTAVNPG